MASDSQSAHPIIPIIVLGVTRSTALKTSSIFPSDELYRVVAALDRTDSPAEYQASPHNLGVVLRTLHPRPRALITGTAVSAEMLDGFRPVWDGYVRDVLRQEDDTRGVWVKVSSHFFLSGP
jgi:hypothetical protein